MKSHTVMKNLFGKRSRNVVVGKKKNVVVVGKKKKKSGRRKNNNVRINNTVGGRKNIVPSRRLRKINIDIYCQLTFTDGVYQFYVEDSEVSYLNLGSLLYQSEEFNRWRLLSYNYKIIGANLNIDFNRKMKEGERYPKLCLWTMTTLNVQSDIKIDNNVMKLDMTNNGMKIYRIRFNRRTSEDEELQWKKTSEVSMPKAYVKIGQLETGVEETEDEHLIIGSVHIGYTMKCLLRDSVYTPEMEIVNNGLKDIAELEKEENEIKKKIEEKYKARAHETIELNYLKKENNDNEEEEEKEEEEEDEIIENEEDEIENQEAPKNIEETESTGTISNHVPVKQIFHPEEKAGQVNESMKVNQDLENINIEKEKKKAQIQEMKKKNEKILKEGMNKMTDPGIKNDPYIKVLQQTTMGEKVNSKSSSRENSKDQKGKSKMKKIKMFPIKAEPTRLKSRITNIENKKESCDSVGPIGLE